MLQRTPFRCNSHNSYRKRQSPATKLLRSQVHSTKAYARQADTVPQWTTFAHPHECYDHSRPDGLHLEVDINIVNDPSRILLHRVRPVDMVASDWVLSISLLSSLTAWRRFGRVMGARRDSLIIQPSFQVRRTFRNLGESSCRYAVKYATSDCETGRRVTTIFI
jgi:hypothetical protein